MTLTPRQVDQYQHLLSILGAMEGALVAFSGGVDSVFLVHAAQLTLGERLLAVTFQTPYTPMADIIDARTLAASLHLRHRVLERPIPDAITTNPAQRCYLCKRDLFGALSALAEEEGLEYVLDGSNTDDLDDYRPGMRAVKELGIRSPLLEAGLCKQDIRDLSCEKGLSTWDKPAGACLLTRLPHDTPVGIAELQRIDKGEQFLKGLGFSVVRLRSHGPLARIELTLESMAACLESPLRETIDTTLKKLGYRYVTVDLGGYRMGSLNQPTTGSGPEEYLYDT